MEVGKPACLNSFIVRKGGQRLDKPRWKVLEHWSLKETAKQMAVVTQFNQLQFDCTVEEIVLLGRTPHLFFFTEGKGKRLCPRSRCSSRWICSRRKLVSIRLCRGGGETTSLISLAPWRKNRLSCSWTNQPITWISSTS